MNAELFLKSFLDIRRRVTRSGNDYTYGQTVFLALPDNIRPLTYNKDFPDPYKMVGTDLQPFWDWVEKHPEYDYEEGEVYD